LLIASRDDPLVPVELFEPLETLNSISLLLTDHGGHLGFIGRRGHDPDRRWMDWRIVDYITAGGTTSARAAA
jgi:predicted alpha/beta-fold hydrolase